jgi:hypothetical protein
MLAFLKRWAPVVSGFLGLWIAYEFIYRYGLVLGWNIGRPPEFWLPEVHTTWRYLSWTHLGTTLGVFIATMPMAAVIIWLVSRPLLFAWILVGCFVLLGPTILLPLEWAEADRHAAAWIMWLADLAKQAFTLPFLVWMGCRLRHKWSKAV